MTTIPAYVTPEYMAALAVAVSQAVDALDGDPRRLGHIGRGAEGHRDSEAVAEGGHVGNPKSGAANTSAGIDR